MAFRRCHSAGTTQAMASGSGGGRSSSPVCARARAGGGLVTLARSQHSQPPFAGAATAGTNPGVDVGVEHLAGEGDAGGSAPRRVADTTRPAGTRASKRCGNRGCTSGARLRTRQAAGSGTGGPPPQRGPASRKLRRATGERRSTRALQTLRPAPPPSGACTRSEWRSSSWSAAARSVSARGAASGRAHPPCHTPQPKLTPCPARPGRMPSAAPACGHAKMAL